MKIKIQDLIGPALDWAVAKCENFSRLDSRVTPEGVRWAGDFFRPTVNWSEGGPIVEREGILFHGVPGDYLAWIPNKAVPLAAPTHLIAAMRCFVASKLGDEVEIPEELA